MNPQKNKVIYNKMHLQKINPHLVLLIISL